MLLIPAIGLKGGKCVFAAAEHPRGKPAQADDPMKVAQNWSRPELNEEQAKT